MRPKKDINIYDGKVRYSFEVNLATKRVELITLRHAHLDADTLIAMYYVPDKVQLEFYRQLKRLNDDYNSTHPNGK